MKLLFCAVALLSVAYAHEASQRIQALRDQIQTRDQPTMQSNDDSQAAGAEQNRDYAHMSMQDLMGGRVTAVSDAAEGMWMNENGFFERSSVGWSFNNGFFTASETGTATPLSNCFYIGNYQIDGSVFYAYSNKISASQTVSLQSGVSYMTEFHMRASNQPIEAYANTAFALKASTKIQFQGTGSSSSWIVSDLGRLADNCRFMQFENAGQCLAWPSSLDTGSAMTLASCSTIVTTLFGVCRWTEGC